MPKPAKLSIYHPILWSKYKATVFSQIHRQAAGKAAEVSFVQIAESERQRMALNAVDLSFHQYPYRLLFKGAYDDVPKTKLALKAFRDGWANDADLILTPGFSDIAHWSLLLAAKLRGKKVATFCDSTLRDRSQSALKGILKRTYFSLCDGYFTYGSRGKEYLQHYGADPKRIFRRVQAAALPAGYSSTQAVRERVDAAVEKDRSPRLIYVGRISPEKGLDLLLNAFSQVLVTYPGARLRLAGSGPIKDELEAMAATLGIAGAVDFLGGLSLENVSLEYAKADLFVLPSTSEPWGLVVNESLHFGCPVIVSDACGCAPDIVRQGVNGFSFVSGDANDLAEKLLLGLSSFTDRLTSAENCIASVAEFNPEASAAQILEGSLTILGSAA